MSRKRPSAAILMTALLTSLASPAQAARDAGTTPVNQPVVSQLDYMTEVDPLRLGDPQETERLAAWFSALSPRYGDVISLDAPKSVDVARVRQIVGKILADYGVLQSPVPRVMNAPVTQGKIRVVLSRATARVPNCPDYRGIGNMDFANKGMPGFGCTINSNLAAMVADPNDLLEGRAAPPGEGWRAAQGAKATGGGLPTGGGNGGGAAAASGSEMPSSGMGPK